MQEVKHEGQVLAIIIRNEFAEPGIHFFTPNEFSLQLAYMNHKTGKIIESHFHNPVTREVLYTKEVLFIKKGVLRVDFFSDECVYLESRILYGGDVILLAAGGHGFEILVDLELIEVKQGPYVGDHDKTRFSSSQINLNITNYLMDFIPV